jgi:hypothetical protein
MHFASLRLFRGLRIVKCFLPLPVVPVECARDTVDPVLLLPVEWQHSREGEARGRDGDIVSGFEFASTNSQS